MAINPKGTSCRNCASTRSRYRSTATAPDRTRICSIRWASAVPSCSTGLSTPARGSTCRATRTAKPAPTTTCAARGFANIGAWILGRNMFGPVRGPWPDDSWKGWWGDEPPYHVAGVRADASSARRRSRWRAARCSISSPTASSRRCARATRCGGRARRPARRRRGNDPPVPARSADRRAASRDLARAARLPASICCTASTRAHSATNAPNTRQASVPQRTSCCANARDTCIDASANPSGAS